jgi:hypothetical protein
MRALKRDEMMEGRNTTGSPEGACMCQQYILRCICALIGGYPDMAVIKRKGCSRATLSIGNSNRCLVCVTDDCGRG